MGDMLRDAIVAVKSLLSRSELVTRAAVVVRDQANTLVRLRLADSPWVAQSGERWLIDTIAPDCATFVDVGGNQGVWSDLMLRAGGSTKRGLIFEPSTSALAVLREKFAAHPELTIVPMAVSDRPGKVTFYEEENAGGTSSCVPGYSKPTAQPREVQVTTVDAALAAHGIARVDVMKVDVEGFDLRVLKGARALLTDHRVGLVQFEYNQMWLGAGSTLREAVDWLESLGMHLYLLNARGLWLPDFRRYGEHLGLSNYVAVSPAWDERMRPHVRGTI